MAVACSFRLRTFVLTALQVALMPGHRPRAASQTHKLHAIILHSGSLSLFLCSTAQSFYHLLHELSAYLHLKFGIPYTSSHRTITINDSVHSDVIYTHITSSRPILSHSVCSPARSNSVYSDFGVVQVIYLFTYLLTF